MRELCASVVGAVRLCNQVVDATDAAEPKSKKSTSRITSEALAPAPKKKTEPEPPKLEPPKSKLAENDENDEDHGNQDAGRIGKGVLDSAVF